MEKDQLRRLEWFLNFLALNLHDLSAQGRAILTLELALNLGAPVDLGALITSVHLDHLQDSLKRLLGKITSNLATARKNQSRLESNGMPSGDAMIIRLVTRIQPKITMSIQIDLLEMQQAGKNGAVDNIKWEKGALENSRLKVTTQGSDFESQLLYQFIQLFDNLPFSALRQCPECNKWFIHTSRHERIFCSSKCASRKSTREKYRALKGLTPKDRPDKPNSVDERDARLYDDRKASGKDRESVETNAAQSGKPKGLIKHSKRKIRV